MFKIAMLIGVLFGLPAVCAQVHILSTENGKQITFDVTECKTGMDIIAPYVEKFNRRFKANIKPSQVSILTSFGFVFPDTPFTGNQVVNSAYFKAFHRN